MIDRVFCVVIQMPTGQSEKSSDDGAGAAKWLSSVRDMSFVHARSTYAIPSDTIIAMYSDTLLSDNDGFFPPKPRSITQNIIIRP